MGDCFVVSFIITTFVLSMLITTTGSGDVLRRGWTPQHLIIYISIKKFPIINRKVTISYLVDLILIFTYHLDD